MRYKKVLSQELKSVCEWLVDKKLSIQKLFGSSCKLSKTEELKVTCNRVSITRKTSVGYLGAEIDQNVSGEAIVNKVLSKVNGRLKFLIRKSKFLDLKTRISVVNAIIQCHFDYACSSWFLGVSPSTKPNYRSAKTNCSVLCLICLLELILHGNVSQ